MTITYDWRGDFENAALNALHAGGFGGRDAAIDWRARVGRHSLGWVCARRGGELVGFVNVAWDGGAHAFILDTVVADFEDHLAGFYFHACGFAPTSAGLTALSNRRFPAAGPGVLA